METLLDNYGLLLGEVDTWFKRSAAHHPENVQCHNGCSECCRGLFDITLLDAFYLKRGFDLLPDCKKTELQKVASHRLADLSGINSNFIEPWLLNSIPEEEWELLMPEEDETPCLLLSDKGNCLLYDYRPMTCRLNGIPLIDISGENMFDEWCTLNFTNADPISMLDIRFDFIDLFGRELMLFRDFATQLTGVPHNEIDLFIPAAIVMEKNIITASI